MAQWMMLHRYMLILTINCHVNMYFLMYAWLRYFLLILFHHRLRGKNYLIPPLRTNVGMYDFNLPIHFMAFHIHTVINLTQAFIHEWFIFLPQLESDCLYVYIYYSSLDRSRAFYIIVFIKTILYNYIKPLS